MSILRTCALALTLFACGGGGDNPGDGDAGGDPDAMPDAGEDSMVGCAPLDPADTDTILGDDAMPAIELVISDENMDKLRAAPREDVPAELIEDGVSFGTVAVHLKGQNSFQPIDMKAGFRIKIDEYVACRNFHGLTDMTLNNMSTDLSMMHDRMAYYMARQAGLPASRANHLLLTINGEFYGLMSNVETIKKKMLKRHFVDNDGPLFEAVDADFRPGKAGSYELKTGPEDRSLIEGLITALAMPNAAQAMTAAASYADVDQFIKYWATLSVIGHLDGFPYHDDDYYLYADPTTGRLVLIPWGMDEAFTATDFDVRMVYSTFAEKCSAVPSCFQQYVDEAWAVVDLMEQLDLDGRREQIAEQIAPHIAMDMRKPYNATMIEQFQTNQHFFIVDRRTYLGCFLPNATNGNGPDEACPLTPP